ncbi:MAG: hypothetical protein LBE34_01770 [Flavobacteriaceae bacterium]|jgi:hypothetical protein|nr:hypothetical protein [Flavobacteriaceae bacterium]
MIISFDLDDTLIGEGRFPLEKEPLISKIFGMERLRLGTINLFKELKRNGHSIYIYTTSYRSKSKIRRMFWSYGILLDKIINQQEHESTLGKRGKQVSKYPPSFEIDLHVDDSLGVEKEGIQYNFDTLILSIDDTMWEDKVLKRVGISK